jgi:hypothetical protein
MKPMEVFVRDLSNKIREVVADRERSYRGQFLSREKRVIRSIVEVERAATNLREAIGRAWGTLTKPAEQHGIRLTEQVREACRSLVERKSDTTYDELKKFQEESVQTTRTIVKTYNKYIPSIVRTAKSESSILEDSITAFSQNVTELGQALDKSNLRELQLIATDADKLVQTARELSLKTEEIGQTKDHMKNLQMEEANLRTALSSLNRDQNLEELNRIEEEARQKETEIRALFESLLKPLRKMDRADSSALKGSSKVTISKIVQNPLSAVLETSTGEMRELLVALRELLERDEGLLDQRRRRKADETIQTLQSGKLDKFKEDHDILEANRREAIRQLKGSGLYDQWLSTHEKSDAASAAISKCQNRISELETEEARLQASVLGSKERVESDLKRILDQQVSILM